MGAFLNQDSFSSNMPDPAPCIDFLAEKLSREPSELGPHLDTTYFHKGIIKVNDAEFFNELCQVMGVQQLTENNSGGYPIFSFADRMPNDPWEIQIKEESALTFEADFGRDYSYVDIHGNPLDL